MSQTQTILMPAPSPGSSPCGAYAACLSFNNGGNAFTPDPNTTSCVANVQDNGVLVSNTGFYLLWRVTATNRGCAANVQGSNTDKSFASSPSNKYTFTVYFLTGSVPAQGDNITLTLTFS